MPVFALLLALAMGSRPDLDSVLLSIQSTIQSGDLDRASQQLDSALTDYPKSGGLYNLRGVVRAQRNELTAAHQDFASAVRLDPKLVPAWQNLARACQIENDSACTIDAWQHVLALQPGDIEAHRSLAVAYEQTQRIPDAEKMLEQLVVLDPKDPAHLLELARLQDKARNYEGALSYLAHARDIAPNDAQIHFLWAQEAMKLNLVAEARASLQRALAIDPQNPAFNYAMGFVLLSTRDAATAGSYFQKYVAARPDNPKGHYALGIAEYASGDYAKSKAEMHRVESDPQTAGGAAYFLGRMARQEDDLDAAARHLQKAIQLLPQFSESHTELARIWMRKGRLADARAELDRAIQLDPQSFEANMQLLVVYRRTRDPRAAAQAARVKQLDESRSKRAELALRTIEVRP